MTNGCPDAVAVYTAVSKGNVAPVVPLGLSPAAIARDSAGRIYVADQCGEILIYAAGSNGNVAPLARIAGGNTQLAATAIALDAAANIYVANSYGAVTIFAAGSNGNVAPTTTISGKNTELTMPIGIGVDSSGKIYVLDHPNNGPAGILEFSKGSQGNVAPATVIAGFKTRLSTPRAMVVNPAGKIYVLDEADLLPAIYVYPAGGGGNEPPIATITGPDTGLNVTSGLAADSTLLYAANAASANGQPDTITVYSGTADGDAPPARTISGPSTGLDRPSGIAGLTGLIYVANAVGDSVTVYGPGSVGNAPPSAKIGNSVKTAIMAPQGIALDSAGQIYAVISNVTSQSEVAIYPPGSNGDAPPAAIISGPSTGLDLSANVMVDSSGKIYVSNPYGGGLALGTITVYPKGAHGNQAPVATIAGANTTFNGPYGLAVDPTGNLYVANSGLATDTGTPSVLVFSPGSNGNIEPAAAITGTHTGLDVPKDVKLDSTGNIYVLNTSLFSANYSIVVYPKGSKGDQLPTAMIEGLNTGLNVPVGLAVAPRGTIYVANTPPFSGYASITIYAPGSNGNVIPQATIAGPATLLTNPGGIAIGP